MVVEIDAPPQVVWKVVLAFPELPPPQEWLFRAGISCPLRAEIEESLRRLRTESIPLYYLHRPDPETPLEDSLAAIKQYQDSGNIRYVGISNVGIEQIERAREVVAITAVQNHYNLSEPRHEDVVDYCGDEGIVFVPYFPLRGDGGPRLAQIAGAALRARLGATRGGSSGCFG